MMEYKKHEYRVYSAKGSCVFRKTKEIYGGLSNMASGFPLRINGVAIRSSEALYQACRFPHLVDVQEKIIGERSPMSAKMVGKPHRNKSRTDWDDSRIKIMRWCLRIKLAQNVFEFGRLLESTLDKPIVEDSSKDDFWGAIRDKNDEDTLRGTNALGRLLMELRQFYNERRYSYEMFVIEPLTIPNFRIFGQPIEVVDEREAFITHVKQITRYSEIENLKNWQPRGVNYPKDISSQALVSESEATLTGAKKKKLPRKTKRAKSTQFEGQAILPF